MSIVDGEPAGSNLIKRVQDIILRPTATWEVIDGEPATIGGLYKGYAIPLAAIGPVAGLICAIVFGYGAFGVTWRPPILNAVVWALVTYLLSLAAVYVVALIIDALAPSFGGTKNQIQAFKVAVYSSTAAWVAGIFQIAPIIGILGIVGLYSLFLMYKGLPKLMKAPEDKALGYTAVVIVLWIIFYVIVGAITAPLLRMGGPGIGGIAGRDGGSVSGTVSVPGVGSVDVGKLEAATKRMEQQARSGKADLVDVAKLKDMLPGNISGYSRGEVSTESSSAGGFGAATAKADYSRGASVIHLTVADLSGAGALAGMAGAFNVEQSRESGASYEKVGRVNGRMTVEEYNRDSRSGKYAVLVGERFMVTAEGNDVAVNDLKSAVGSIDAGRLERMAN